MRHISPRVWEAKRGFFKQCSVYRGIGGAMAEIARQNVSLLPYRPGAKVDFGFYNWNNQNSLVNSLKLRNFPAVMHQLTSPNKQMFILYAQFREKNRSNTSNVQHNDIDSAHQRHRVFSTHSNHTFIVQQPQNNSHIQRHKTSSYIHLHKNRSHTHHLPLHRHKHISSIHQRHYNASLHQYNSSSVLQERNSIWSTLSNHTSPFHPQNSTSYVHAMNYSSLIHHHDHYNVSLARYHPYHNEASHVLHRHDHHNDTFFRHHGHHHHHHHHRKHSPLEQIDNDIIKVNTTYSSRDIGNTRRIPDNQYQNHTSHTKKVKDADLSNHPRNLEKIHKPDAILNVHKANQFNTRKTRSLNVSKNSSQFDDSRDQHYRHPSTFPPNPKESYDVARNARHNKSYQIQHLVQNKSFPKLGIVKPSKWENISKEFPRSSHYQAEKSSEENLLSKERMKALERQTQMKRKYYIEMPSSLMKISHEKINKTILQDLQRQGEEIQRGICVTPAQRAALTLTLRTAGNLLLNIEQRYIKTRFMKPHTLKELFYLADLDSLGHGVLLKFSSFSLEKEKNWRFKHREFIMSEITGALRRLVQLLSFDSFLPRETNAFIDASAKAKLRFLRSLAPSICRLRRSVFDARIGECITVQNLNDEMQNAILLPPSPFAYGSGPYQTMYFTLR